MPVAAARLPFAVRVRKDKAIVEHARSLGFRSLLEAHEAGYGTELKKGLGGHPLMQAALAFTQPPIFRKGDMVTCFYYNHECLARVVSGNNGCISRGIDVCIVSHPEAIVIDKSVGPFLPKELHLVTP